VKEENKQSKKDLLAMFQHEVFHGLEQISQEHVNPLGGQ
jgi:hypothetical protein